MGHIHIAVSLFGEVKKEHLLLTNYYQAGRKDYSRLHKEVRASRPVNRVVEHGCDPPKL